MRGLLVCCALRPLSGQPVDLPVVDIEITAPVVTEIVTTIEQNIEIVGQIGTGIHVIGCQQQNTSIGTTFEVTITNDVQAEFVLTVEQNITTGGLVVIDTRPIKNTISVTKPVNESTIEINVDVVTGIKKEWKVSVNVTQEIVVKPAIISSHEC